MAILLSSLNEVAQATLTRDCQIQCGPRCSWIFSRLRIWPQIVGGTRVEWSLHPRFADAQPHTFQLQVGRTGNPEADDWVDVGLPVVDSYYAIDDAQRVYGKRQWTHYRLVLTTAEGAYASDPQDLFGNLVKKDWLRAREILRLESLRLRKEAGKEGYLLKRRLFGDPCTCLDLQTGEVKNPQHELCFGTGFIGGYFAPYPCFYVELTPVASDNRFDSGGTRGTTDDMPRVRGRMLNVPQVNSFDVWVDRYTDQRWVIREAIGAAEIRGDPLVLFPVGMRLLPYSDPVYKLVIADQVPS